MKTALYRHYDGLGGLLYVGIADCLSRRDKQHFDDDWFDDVCETTTHWYADRQCAAKAERSAIRKEQPRYNRLHATSRTQSPLNDFIYSVGRHEFQFSVGVSPQSVTRALSEGLMPCTWFLRVRDLCAAHHIDCPEELFKWHTPDHGDAA